MSIPADKLAEALALPKQDRAFLAHQLIASLDEHLDENVDENVDEQWLEVVERRSQEIREGKPVLRPVEESLQEIETEIDALRKPS